MFKRVIALCIILSMQFSGLVWAADLLLEDINFPFDSASVVDDLKQIPRLAEKLRNSPGLILEISGHADAKGSAKYNNKLSLKRANAVKNILIKEGVSPDKIVITGHGKGQPKENNRSGDGRFVNRRVVFSLYYLKDGKKDYLYKDNAFVRDDEQEKTVQVAQTRPAQQGETPKKDDHDDIIKRLDRIEASLNKKPAEQQVVVREERPAEKVVMKESKAADMQTSLSFAPGVDEGRLSGSIEGRVFLPLSDMFALQGGLRGNLTNNLQEYQLDAGIVGKYDRMQLGLFGSSKLAKLKGFSKTGNLSQLAVLASYMFDRGSIGAFATKGIKTEDVILTEERYDFSDLIITETYLKIRDTYGVNFDYDFTNGVSVEANVGIINADNADATGRVKVGYPIGGTGDKLRVFVQGGFNGGLVRDSNDVSAMLGLELGNWKHRNGAVMAEGIRPMQVPDISYELKKRTRVLASGVNLPPVVSISASAVSGPPPLAITFTGNATDPDGTVETMQWNFGDGAEATGQTVTHTFNTIGTYLVTLTATDNKGGKSTANIQITVDTNILPVVSISASTVSGKPPLAITFTADATDPDGTIEGLQWNFGDGSTGTGSSVSHTFNAAGTYMVTVTATDNRGGKTTANLQVSVLKDLPPVVSITASKVSGLHALTVTFTGNAVDPDGTVANLSWNFGDGATASGLSVTHTFINTGIYLVSLTATDSAGNKSYANVQITVENTSPVAFAGGDATYTLPTGVISLNASGSFDPDGDVLSFQWRQVSGPAVTVLNPYTSTAQFTPSVAGVYIFQLLVKDGQGGVSTATATITVN